MVKAIQMFGESLYRERESHVFADPLPCEFRIPNPEKMVRLVKEDGRYRVFGKRWACYGVWKDGREFLIGLHESAREAAEHAMSSLQEWSSWDLEDVATVRLCELVVDGPFADGELLVRWIVSRSMGSRVQGLKKRLKCKR